MHPSSPTSAPTRAAMVFARTTQVLAEAAVLLTRSEQLAHAVRRCHRRQRRGTADPCPAPPTTEAPYRAVWLQEAYAAPPAEQARLAQWCRDMLRDRGLRPRYAGRR